MDATNIADVVEAIKAGELDNGLSAIAEACQTRQKKTIHLLSPGDQIRFNGLTRPKYLAGTAGTVKSVKQTTVVVTIDENVGKYHAGVEIRVPASLVEPV